MRFFVLSLATIVCLGALAAPVEVRGDHGAQLSASQDAKAASDYGKAANRSGRKGGGRGCGCGC